MKTINFKTVEKTYPTLREIESGDVFTIAGGITPFIKGFMRENDKIKVINLQTGEIINIHTDTSVVPYDVNIDLTPKI